MGIPSKSSVPGGYMKTLYGGEVLEFGMPLFCLHTHLPHFSQ